MKNLPSVGARSPRRSGWKSGYVRWQFFGGLSPLRGPLASATAGSSIAKRPTARQEVSELPAHGSFQQAERAEEPAFLRHVLLEVARERRAVAVIVVGLERALGDAEIGFALCGAPAGVGELALDLGRQAGGPDERAEAERRHGETLPLQRGHGGKGGSARGGEQGGHAKAAGGGGGERHRGGVEFPCVRHLHGSAGPWNGTCLNSMPAIRRIR